MNKPVSQDNSIPTPDDVIPAWYIRACYSKNPLYVLRFIAPTVALLFWASTQFIETTQALWLGLAGIFVWTFYEYWLHRSFFHWTPKNALIRVWVERIHINHHHRPYDLHLLNAGPAFVAPQATLLYLTLALPFGWANGAALLAGALVGYFFYELFHYSAHAYTGEKGWTGWLRKFHRQHHHADWNSRFGVSSPFWDLVFRTYRPKPKAQKRQTTAA